jgi:2-oxoglutarate ferredoxin oxidoreductase subunit gamma
MSRHELRIAGFGGQGVITAGYVLASAASIHEGKHALMTQSYGPEARGGACKADIIISDEPIDYPKTSSLDYLVALSVDAYTMFNEEVREGGAIIYDGGLVSIPDAHRKRGVSFHGVPAAEVAEELGSPLSANMVMLGSLLRVTGVVGPDAVREAIRERFPRRAAVNLEALERGRELVRPP